MNARTQITLDPDTRRRARAKAAAQGISFAEYVRRLLANDLGEEKPKVNISEVFDLGSSGEPTDIARDKDKMIGRALWEEYLRDTEDAPGARARSKVRRR
jgi:hypothetical protein